MRDFNEIKKALWLTYNQLRYSYYKDMYGLLDSRIDGKKVNSLEELFYRYRTKPIASEYVKIRTRHRSPLLDKDVDISGVINVNGLQALVNELCENARTFSDVRRYTPLEPVDTVYFEVTYKVLKPVTDTAPLVIYALEIANVIYRTEYKLQQSATVGVFTDKFSFDVGSSWNDDIYVSYKKFATNYNASTVYDNIEILSLKPVDSWKDADKKEEKVLHKFSYVVNISANPAVLKVYAKNDAIEKCSLDADKYVDTDLNKVVYTATYANGATATIDFWSYDENEELVVYQNLNCTLGEKIQSW